MTDLAGLVATERLAGVLIVFIGFGIVWLLRTGNSRIDTFGAGGSFSFLGAIPILDSYVPLSSSELIILVACGWLAMGLFAFRITKSIVVLLAFIAVPSIIGIFIFFS